MVNSARRVHPNALPGYKQASIPRAKLEGYLLNPAHIVGKHKAKVFKSALGFDQGSWRLLETAIRNELPYNEAQSTKNDSYGRRYNVTITIKGPNGSERDVTTAWIVKTGDDQPSFVTAHVR